MYGLAPKRVIEYNFIANEFDVTINMCQLLIICSVNDSCWVMYAHFFQLATEIIEIYEKEIVNKYTCTQCISDV